MILTSKVSRRLWKRRHIIYHIPIKQVWLEKNNILIKDVQIWVDQKHAKEHNEKKGSL